jgi:surface antigen
MSNLSKLKLGKFLATIAALSSVTAILSTANKAEALTPPKNVPLFPNDFVNDQVVRLQMEKSAPNGAPVTINITPNYGFKNDGLVNTWVGPVDDDSLFKYLTNGSGINFQRVNSGYSLSSKDLNIVQGNPIVSYGSGFGRWQDWNLEKIGGQYGDTYLFRWRTDINTNLCLDVRGFTQGQQLNNRTPVLWTCDRNNVNQRIRVIKQGVPPPSDSILANSVLQPGSSIKSKNQCFVLNAQPDGNLVLYRKSNGQALWATGTDRRNVKQTVFQADGNLVIYNTSNTPIWASGTDRRGGAKLAVQDDGNFVMYNSQNQPLWQTNTLTSCAPPIIPPVTPPVQDPKPPVVPPRVERDSLRKINDFVNQWNGKTGITRYDLGGSDYNGQCVTLVARYLQDHYGASKTGLVIGNGGQTARTVGTNFSSFIWETNDDPMPGSIISFPSLGYGYGHVALVVSAKRDGTNLKVQILDSNGDNAGPNSVVRLRDINVDTRSWTAGNYGSILYSNPRD